MTAERLQKIQEDIKAAENLKARAEGALENIKDQWRKDYDCQTPEEVKELLKAWEKQAQTLREKYQTLTDEIEAELEELDE